MRRSGRLEPLVISYQPPGHSGPRVFERLTVVRTTVTVRIAKEIAVLLGEIFGMDGVVVVVVVAVLIFGGTAIPKFARNLGSSDKATDAGETKSPDADK